MKNILKLGAIIIASAVGGFLIGMVYMGGSTGGTTGLTNLDVNGTLNVDGAVTLQSGLTLASTLTSTSAAVTLGTTTTERLTTGGNRLSTTTIGSIDTLKGVQMEANNYIDYVTGLTAGITLTLQATSSWPSTFIPNVGDQTVFTIRNATSTGAGVPLTLAAGAGVLFRNSTSTLIMGETDTVDVRLIRQADTDVTVGLTFYK